MLNRSMHSTAGATISILPNKSGFWSVPQSMLSRDKERNLHYSRRSIPDGENFSQGHLKSVFGLE